MGNQEHLEILQRGVESWNLWRRENPDVKPDLSNLNARFLDLQRANFSDTKLQYAKLAFISLRHLDLTNADLSFADLSRSDLRDSVLRGAFLFRADVSFASLQGVDLSDTMLAGADFSYSTLKEANLTGAVLDYAIFQQAILVKANLTNAYLLGSIFGDTRLGGAKGLASCFHRGPSVIDLRTILNSTPIPEKFLRGCGIPKEALPMISRLNGMVKYYSAFIAYGEPDRRFAEGLYSKLDKKGVTCWAYAIDSTPGKRTWKEIGEKRRAADKFIILCSSKSLIRDGALKEIEEQIDEDPEKLIPISLDNLWKEPGFKVMRGSRDLKPDLLERNYTDFANLTYNRALSKLVKGLER